MLSKTKNTAERIEFANNYLRRIFNARTATERNTLLKKAPLSVIKHICNLCNVVVRHGNKTYSSERLKRIGPHLKSIRYILAAKPSLKRKRRVLQKGGFFPILASILAPAIGGLISALTNRNNNNG